MRFSEHYYITEISQAAINKAIGKFVKQGEEESIVTKLVNDFNTLTSRNKIKGVDIFSVSFGDLQKMVVDATKKKSRSEKAKIIKDEETDFVFENDDVLVVTPLTHASSCKYGSQTKWCTTEHDSRYWDEYYSKGVNFYYIIPKDGSEKTAVAVYVDGRREIYDALDDSVLENNFEEILEQYNIPDNIFDPLDKDEAAERGELTEKEIIYFVETLLYAVDIRVSEVEEEEFESATEHAKNIISVRADDYSDLGRVDVRSFVESDIQNMSYGIDTGLDLLEEKYGIDKGNIKNRLHLFFMTYLGEELEYSMDNDEQPFDKETINNDKEWIYLYKNISIEDFVENLNIDFADDEGLEEEERKYIEGWLKHEYNNNHENFVSFYDDIMEIAEKVSDKIKEQLKELIDKVERVEYGKQDHPTLDLQTITYANWYLDK